MLKAALVELEKDGLIKKSRIKNRDQYCLTGKETYEKFTLMFSNLQEIKKHLTKSLTLDEKILMLNNYVQFVLFLINSLVLFEASKDDPKYGKIKMKQIKLIREGLENDVIEKMIERDSLIQHVSSYVELDIHVPRLISLDEYREFKNKLTPQQRDSKQIWRFTF